MRPKVVSVNFCDNDGYERNSKDYYYFTNLDLSLDDIVIVEARPFGIARVSKVMGLTKN